MFLYPEFLYPELTVCEIEKLNKTNCHYYYVNATYMYIWFGFFPSFNKHRNKPIMNTLIVLYSVFPEPTEG